MAKSTPITLRLDTELYNVLQDIAKREEIPASYVIRRALRKGLGLDPAKANIRDTTAELAESWE
jgi:predicted transcriptional regulator